MDFIAEHHEIIAGTLARTFLGILFLFQGYDALFGVGLKRATQTYWEGFESVPLPHFWITAMAWYTSISAFVGGLLLIFGLLQYFALCLLAINLLAAAVGFALIKPLWDMSLAWPRLILTVLLLLLPPKFLDWSLDYLILHF